MPRWGWRGCQTRGFRPTQSPIPVAIIAAAPVSPIRKCQSRLTPYEESTASISKAYRWRPSQPIATIDRIKTHLKPTTEILPCVTRVGRHDAGGAGS